VTDYPPQSIKCQAESVDCLTDGALGEMAQPSPPSSNARARAYFFVEATGIMMCA